MIAWILTAYTPAVASDLVADVASDRNAAIASAAEAFRRAVVEAGRSTSCNEAPPTFKVMMDGEVVASVVMKRTDLGKLDVDHALDGIEQFERLGINSVQIAKPVGVSILTTRRGSDGNVG